MNMEKAKEWLQLRQEELEAVSQLSVPSPHIGVDSFYQRYIVRGIQIDQIDEGFIACNFKVPSRLTDRTGKLATGAITSLIDELGGAVTHVEGLPVPASITVDMSISYLSSAHVDDELEITCKLLGRRGGYSGALVLVRNKATKEIIAEGQISLFGRHVSKMDLIMLKDLKHVFEEMMPQVNHR